MKKLMICLMLGILLISLTSALEFDNIKSVGETGKAGYPNLKIENVFGLGKTLWEGELTKNTHTCGISCEAEQTITIKEKGSLVDDVRFYTINEDESRTLQNIRGYNFYYKTAGEMIDVNDYELRCTEKFSEKNGTTYEECENVLIGTHKEEMPEWTEFYLGQEFEAGTYEIKVFGEKKPSRTVDWQIKTNGIWTTDWAIWGNISLGDEAEVILNSPADGYTTLVNQVQFNASATITGGAFLTNMSLWTNETGSWGLRNFTDVPAVHNFVLDAHGTILSSTGSSADKIGMEIVIGANDVNLTNVTKVGTNTATKAHILYNTNGTVLASADFVGNTATFTGITLLANTYYWVTTDGNGGSVTYVYSAGGSASGTRLNWVRGGSYPEPADPSNRYNIVSIGTTIDEFTATTLTQTWNRTLTDTTLWNVQGCDTDGDCGFASANRTLLIDATAPTVMINSGNGTQNYGSLSVNHTINFTATDTNLDKCWISYNSTNRSVSCSSGILKSYNFTLVKDLYTARIWSNDSVGNIASESVEWDYKVFENSRSFNAITQSGSTENYISNLTLGSGVTLSSASLIYGNDTLSANIFSSGNNRTIAVYNYEVPTYPTDTNVSFYWNIVIDSTEINTSNSTQIIQAVLLDDCSSYTYKLFNLSLLDEITKSPLLGNIELNYQILNKLSYNIINSTVYGLTNVSSGSICSEINLSGTNMAYSVEIRYYADGYAYELYHIQNADITGSTQSINLYDLNSSKSTEFKIIYQDNNYNFVDEAIIQLQRKYISEGIYEVVEAPLTSNEGTAIVHIDLDSNKYRATVVKNGVVLDTFDNLVFKCESQLTGECTQRLLGTINPGNIENIDNVYDFTYSDPVKSNETISVSFSIPSGTPSLVGISLLQQDQFGNKTLCNRTVLTSAGSIECEYDRTIGDSIVEVIITKEGSTILEQSYLIPEEGGLDFLGNNFFIVLLLILSLVGMSFTSPEWIIMNGVITFVLAGAIWLIRGLDFVIGLGGLAWLLIAAGILIFKIAKQEDR